MRTFFIAAFILLVSTSLFAQNQEEEIQSEIWGNNDPDFAVAKCNDKYKNESAVILCKKYEYHIRKQVIAKLLDEQIYIHTRILLLDKAAVNEFSTFKFEVSKSLGAYFGWGSSNNNILVGIKIIKPDKTEKIVPIDKKLIDKIKSNLASKEIQKVAVPNLEPGDIIDYFYASIKTLNVSNIFIFSPVMYPLVGDYPIVKQKIEMHIMRKCYLNARSMNGAPEFVLQNDSKKGDMVYTITDTDRDKAKQQIYTYPLREFPVIMFQTIFTNTSSYKNRYCFYDKEDIIKKKITDAELLAFTKNISSFADLKAVSLITKYLSQNYKKESDVRKVAIAAYYYYRQYVFGENYRKDIVDNMYHIEPPSDLSFAATLTEALRRRKIDEANSVITVPNEIGTINDIVMINQMGFLVKIDAPTPLFLSSFDRNSLASELDPSYQGTKGKIYSELYNNLKDVDIPVAKCDENYTLTKLNVTFSIDEAEKLSISYDHLSKGRNKNYYNQALILPENYFQEYTQTSLGIEMKKIARSKTDNRFEQVNDERKKQRDEYLTYMLKDDYDVTEVTPKNFNLVQPGIWENKPELKFNLQFELNKYITKTGNNIIIDAGKLIGDQVTPDKSDSVRKYNIYMPYSRKFEDVISIAIPRGYKVKGLEKFTYNIVNETGGFNSEAKIEEPNVVIKTSKYFQNNYEPKANWPKLLKFIDAANDFRNQKLLFVPEE